MKVWIIFDTADSYARPVVAVCASAEAAESVRQDRIEARIAKWQERNPGRELPQPAGIIFDDSEIEEWEVMS